jgi:hypothetical protein
MRALQRQHRAFCSEFRKGPDLEERRTELVEHLIDALQLEHATIPPYLCALYSIRDPDRENREAASVLRSVAVEEMLHMTLVANLLNAIQATPREPGESAAGVDVDRKGFIPDYPAYLPRSNEAFEVHLRKFSPEAIENFLQIEQPAEPNAESQHDTYDSIGQFYAAIKDELFDICHDFSEKDLFLGDASRQITPEYYYSGGGEVVPVADYESAHRAIKIIVDEGEGFSDSIFSGDHEQFGEQLDLAHYFKFNQILAGRFYRPSDSPSRAPTGQRFPTVFGDAAVYPANFELPYRDYSKDLRIRAEECDLAYWRLLAACRCAFSGQPAALYDAVPLMLEIKHRMIDLMRIPVGDSGFTAAPRFLRPKRI